MPDVQRIMPKAREMANYCKTRSKQDRCPINQIGHRVGFYLPVPINGPVLVEMMFGFFARKMLFLNGCDGTGYNRLQVQVPAVNG
jgi:hypothetical protein